ncbi:MAG TPA: acyl carrier protein [Rhodospirillaceae bacterium]|nr:acyl carrier protein [Rhodospirillaceae bacterium]
MTRQEILENITKVLTELFEVPAEKVVPEAKLYEDLELDSIDAIDLIVKIQAITGRRVKPQEFKNVRTVGDVLDCVEKLLASDEII